jgi:hypothetical protein
MKLMVNEIDELKTILFFNLTSMYDRAIGTSAR